nr:uncharacterized protein LOC111989559 [Quercus suber]POE80317.1 hypothetical protein CFP56_14081 [Quercus suber]
MASPQTTDFNAPRFPPPPPPFHPRAPPPPHVRPPPPPSPPSDNHPTVIVIVFISFGSLLFLAFLAAALFCFLKKKKKKAVQEVEIIHVDEHKKVREAIIPGPRGTQSVILSIEDDVHIDERIAKNEKFGHAGLHAKSVQGESGSTNKERGSSSSSFDQQQFDKSLDHKSITQS